MPIPCTICNHSDRAAIDATIADHRPLTQVASAFHVARTSLQRHRDNHLKPSLEKSKRLATDLQLNHLNACLNQIYAHTHSVLIDNLNNLDNNAALKTIHRLERLLALAFQFSKHSRDAGSIAQDFAFTPKKDEDLSAIILASIQPYPAAFAAFSQALKKHTQSGSAVQHTDEYRANCPLPASNLNKPDDCPKQ